MKIQMTIASSLILVLSALPIHATEAVPDVAAVASFDTSNWQMRRLMQPTEAERLREARGEVVIYDGLTDRQVDAVLNAHADRMKNMMFVGTLITDDAGEAYLDPVGGMFAQEDDGC
jgi:hypothetical protein